MSLFSFMLPTYRNSLTAEPLADGTHLEYCVYITYDEGDAFYDNEAREAEMDSWVQDKMVRPLAAKGIALRFARLRWTGPTGKPGPVFNFMMAAAFEDGADYLYRVNDDTQFELPGWAQVHEREAVWIHACVHQSMLWLW